MGSFIYPCLCYGFCATLASANSKKRNTVHFKSLRRVFKIKSSLYHRVLDPPSADCSNEYFAGLAFSARHVPTPFQLYSQQRFQLLGHLYRHVETLEYQVIVMGSHAYKHVASSNRAGPHWAESCLTEAIQRTDFAASDAPPSHSDLHNAFFAIPTLSQIQTAHATSSIVWMHTTLLCIERYNPIARIERDGRLSSIDPAP